MIQTDHITCVSDTFQYISVNLLFITTRQLAYAPTYEWVLDVSCKERNKIKIKPRALPGTTHLLATAAKTYI